MYGKSANTKFSPFGQACLSEFSGILELFWDPGTYFYVQYQYYIKKKQHTNKKKTKT